MICTYFLNVKRKYEITIEMAREETCVWDIKCIDTMQYHFFIFSRVVIFKEDHISPRINSLSKEDRHLTCDASIVYPSFFRAHRSRYLVPLYFQDGARARRDEDRWIGKSKARDSLAGGKLRVVNSFCSS